MILSLKFDPFDPSILALEHLFSSKCGFGLFEDSLTTCSSHHGNCHFRRSNKPEPARISSIYLCSIYEC